MEWKTRRILSNFIILLITLYGSREIDECSSQIVKFNSSFKRKVSKTIPPLLNLLRFQHASSQQHKYLSYLSCLVKQIPCQKSVSIQFDYPTRPFSKQRSTTSINIPLYLPRSCNSLPPLKKSRGRVGRRQDDAGFARTTKRGSELNEQACTLSSRERGG